MTENQLNWAQAKRRLTSEVRSLGFPEEFADLMAKQLRSPGAMDRMTSWLGKVRPKSTEMIVDEMLAIAADVETWRKQKEAREAQAGYNAWLNSETRWQNMEDDE